MDTLFLDYWYFFNPNYVLAILVYTLLGRMLLGIFVPQDWDNYIWQAFCRLTDWALRIFGYITPQVFHGIVLLPITAVWLMLVRVVFTIVMSQLGLLPAVGQTPAVG